MLGKIKKLSVLAAAAIGISAFSAADAYAANGDVCGKIYSTDILALINGCPAPSYNIGGRTAIVLEELYDMGYGISLDYNDELRTLRAKPYFASPQPPETPEIPRGSVGETVGDIYESDIKVIFNGNEVKGFNIGGRTAVVIEDLGEPDDSPNAEYGYSKYLANYEWNSNDRTIALNLFNARSIPNSFSRGSIERLANTAYCFNDNIVTGKFDRLRYTCSELDETVLSEEILRKPFTLMPFYYSDDTSETPLGIMYVDDDGIVNALYSDRDVLLKASEYLADTPMSNDELFNYLDNKTDFETMAKIETDDFWFVIAKKLKPDADDSYAHEDAFEISVRKSGGYGLIGREESDKISAARGEENKIDVTISPFAGPHGATNLHYELNLDWYNVR